MSEQCMLFSSDVQAEPKPATELQPVSFSDIEFSHKLTGCRLPSAVDDGPFLIEVIPAMQQGANLFFWLNIVSRGTVEGTRRPINRNGIDMILQAFHIDPSLFRWKSEPCERQENNDLLNKPVSRAVAREDGYVYFIQSGFGGPVKIGWAATSVECRMKELQTGNPETLVVLGFMPGAITLESELHRKFREFSIRGEWFWPAPEILKMASECPNRHYF